MEPKRRLHTYTPVDYSKLQNDRHRKVNYLRAGSFKKIAGVPIFGRSIRRRRVYLAVCSGIVFITGIYFVFF